MVRLTFTCAWSLTKKKVPSLMRFSWSPQRPGFWEESTKVNFDTLEISWNHTFELLSSRQSRETHHRYDQGNDEESNLERSQWSSRRTSSSWNQNASNEVDRLQHLLPSQLNNKRISILSREPRFPLRCFRKRLPIHWLSETKMEMEN